MKASSTTQLPPTTSSVILNDCKRWTENSAIVARWVVENPWIDKADLDCSYPGISIIRFPAHCKGIVIEHLGASGWTGSSDQFEKVAAGIKFQIRREPVTLFGEIPEEEMKEVK